MRRYRWAVVTLLLVPGLLACTAMIALAMPSSTIRSNSNTQGSDTSTATPLATDKNPPPNPTAPADTYVSSSGKWAAQPLRVATEYGWWVWTWTAVYLTFGWSEYFSYGWSAWVPWYNPWGFSYSAGWSSTRRYGSPWLLVIVSSGLFFSYGWVGNFMWYWVTMWIVMLMSVFAGWKGNWSLVVDPEKYRKAYADYLNSVVTTGRGDRIDLDEMRKHLSSSERRNVERNEFMKQKSAVGIAVDRLSQEKYTALLNGDVKQSAQDSEAVQALIQLAQESGVSYSIQNEIRNINSEADTEGRRWLSRQIVDRKIEYWDKRALEGQQVAEAWDAIHYEPLRTLKKTAANLQWFTRDVLNYFEPDFNKAIKIHESYQRLETDKTEWWKSALAGLDASGWANKAKAERAILKSLAPNSTGANPDARWKIDIVSQAKVAQVEASWRRYWQAMLDRDTGALEEAMRAIERQPGVSPAIPDIRKVEDEFIGKIEAEYKSAWDVLKRPGSSVRMVELAVEKLEWWRGQLPSRAEDWDKKYGGKLGDDSLSDADWQYLESLLAGTGYSLDDLGSRDHWQTGVAGEQKYPGALIKGGINYSQLITDDAFTDSQSMSESEIRELLNGYANVIKNPSMPVWEYEQDNKTKRKSGRTVDVAHLIYLSSRAFQINPKVLLTKLQKEEVLVTGQWDGAQIQPDWKMMILAMGFGVNDGQQQTSDYAWTGIDRQIVLAALLSRYYFNGQSRRYPTPSKYPATFPTGEGPVPVFNRSTWVLYRYTPHTVTADGQGNIAFVNAWDDFFGKIARGVH